MTRLPWPPDRKARIVAASVVTGTPRSAVQVVKLSAVATVSSEQTARYSNRLRCLGCPSPEGLTKQRQRRDDDQRPIAPERFIDPHCGERLAGATRHQKLAAVFIMKAVNDVADRLDLMGERSQARQGLRL